MDAFRRTIALAGALFICALAAACASQAEPNGLDANGLPPDSSSWAAQVEPTPTAPGSLGVVHAQDQSLPGPLTTPGAQLPANTLSEESSTGGNADLSRASSGRLATEKLDPVEAPLLFGPIDGAITHDPTRAGSMRSLIGAEVRDVVISADFKNPFDPSRRPFDHGFLLRVSGERFHAVVLSSDGNWKHFVSDGSKVSLKESGKAAGVTLDRGETNSLTVVAAGKTGWLFINGLFAASLDLSGLSAPGDAGPVANVGSPTQVFGAQTTYQSLTVGGLTAIDAADSGALVHDLAGKANGELLPPSSSLFAEAAFEVPYASGDGDWSFGLRLLCDDGSEYRVVFNDRALWKLQATPAGAGARSVTTFGSTPTASFDPGTSNQLIVVRVQGEWRVFLNGGFLTTMDIREDLLPVGLSIVAGVDDDEQPAGFESLYSGFHVWALGY